MIGKIRGLFPNVREIIDARSQEIVEVTLRDIAIATALSINKCALAVACTRQLKSDGAIILINTGFLIYGAQAIRYRLAGTIGRETTCFDRGGDFDPGKYLLSPPPKRRKKRIAEKRARSKRASFRHFTRNVRSWR
jgi:hypothetical protein